MNRINGIILSGMFCFLLIVPAASYAACSASVSANAPDSRYTNNNDGTVSDKVTGLMWKQCSEGQSITSSACDTGSVTTYTWQEALQQAANINGGGGFAGYTDWRLPNRNELASLVERQCTIPAINERLFPGLTLAANYWSSSAPKGGAAWRVSFFQGGEYLEFMSSSAAVRLVRGGL